MSEILLKYLGKKIPFKTPPIIKPEYEFFHDALWVDTNAALKLMEINPAMFAKLGERQDGENIYQEAGEVKPKEDLEETFVCDICGKEYTDEKWYFKHIEKCKESVDG